MIDAFFSGDIKTATELHYKLRPLHHAMFIETNPIPVKAALALLGQCEAEMRLPLLPMSQTNLDRLASVMAHYGLPVRYWKEVY